MMEPVKPKRRLSTDIVGVLTGNLSAMVAVLLSNVVLSRGLGPDQYGIYSSLMAVVMVSLSIVQMGISRSVVFHLGKKNFDHHSIVGAVFTILIFASVMGILISIGSLAVIRNPNFSLLMMILVVLVIPPILGNVYLGGVYLGLEEIRSSNQTRYLPTFFTLILVFLFIQGLHFGILGAILAVLASSCIGFALAARPLVRRFSIKVPAPREVVVSLGRLGFVYAITFMMLQLNYKADVLLLQKMRPAAEVGFYSLGVSITEQLWLIPFAMGLVLMSRTANDTDDAQSIGRTVLLLRVGVVFGVLASVVLYFLAPMLVPLIFGADYIASVPVVRAILPGIVIFIIFRLLESNLAGMGKPYLAVWALVPSLLLNLGLNLWLIPQYGALGAAWATNVSYALATIVYVAIYMHQMKVNFATLFLPVQGDVERVKQLLIVFRNRDKKRDFHS